VFTRQEIKALQHFRPENCGSTPHLLDFTGDFVDAGTDKKGMVDGYAIFIFITKVPGERLTYDKYWKLSLAERDEIRVAFKEAIL
jgi:hypothetical protein